MSLNEFHDWLLQKKVETSHEIEQIPFNQLTDWCFDDITGNLVHNSGRFFSIEGIDVTTNWGNVSNWSQPIINQPEVGFLGIITKKFNGVLYFLMQAKKEPGNINVVQLSPTLQATKSNYTQVHKGNTPHYLEYFMNDRSDVNVLMDQLQSEQGARFLKKRNRNIIIEISEDIEIKDEFCWLTLGQIKELLQFDNIVNMDTRTVISGISFGSNNEWDKYENIQLAETYYDYMLNSELDNSSALMNIESVISWITKLKSFAQLDVIQVPLKYVVNWEKNELSLYHKEKKYFEVIAVKTSIGSREVSSWTQPIVKSAQEGIIAFLIKKINGVYHFLVQAKLEPGNFDIIELAPTIQCLTGNYRKGKNEYDVMFIDYALYPEKYGAEVKYSTYQSEEGGRFYQEQNRNMIIEVFDEFKTELPEKYCWMTLNQLKTFIKFNNYLNIQARSLLAAVKFC